MSKPNVVKWSKPHLSFNKETDEVVLQLGEVNLPASIDPDKMEAVLNIVTELVDQMVEDDIIPSLMDPDFEVAPADNELFDDSFDSESKPSGNEEDDTDYCQNDANGNY